MVGNKENADFVRRETKDVSICDVGNKENADFVRWETKRMLIL
jgi:hypothetical protein